MIEASESTFSDEVLEKGGLVLVDFWAPWCGPCRMLESVIEKVAKTYSDHIRFIRVNLDENPSIGQKYHISGIPCLLLFDGREETSVADMTAEGNPHHLARLVDRSIGYVPEKTITAMLDRHLA